MHSSIEIIHEDQDLVAIHKPSGWLTIPDRYDPDIPSVKKWFESKGSNVFIVHRIDRDTSGLLLLAKHEAAHKYFNDQFEQRLITKTYYGLVTGNVSDDHGTFDQPIEAHPTMLGKMRVGRKGKSAITHFKVEQRFKGFTWIRFQIETGRTHQIRVHMQNAGHSLVCDPLYGLATPLFLSSIKRKKFNLSKNVDEERPLLARLALHASQVNCIGFDGKELSITAQLPKDLDATLKQLAKWSN